MRIVIDVLKVTAVFLFIQAVGVVSVVTYIVAYGVWLDDLARLVIVTWSSAALFIALAARDHILACTACCAERGMYHEHGCPRAGRT